MRKIAIYPGRFHPFHKGHKGTYDYLVKKYGATNVFVVSSGIQAPVKSPFTFDEKKVMMQALGIPESQIVQVKNPYIATEVTSHFDKESTAVVFALSDKDLGRITFKPKKDGSPSYLQPVSNRLEPLSKHGYVDLAPVVNFQINGKSYDSASDIRKDYVAADDQGRMNMIMGLYGKADKRIKHIFDNALALSESLNRLEESMLSIPLTESASIDINDYKHIIESVNRLEQEANDNEYSGIK